MELPEGVLGEFGLKYTPLSVDQCFVPPIPGRGQLSVVLKSSLEVEELVPASLYQHNTKNSLPDQLGVQRNMIPSRPRLSAGQLGCDRRVRNRSW